MPKPRSRLHRRDNSLRTRVGQPIPDPVREAELADSIRRGAQHIAEAKARIAAETAASYVQARAEDPATPESLVADGCEGLLMLPDATRAAALVELITDVAHRAGWRQMDWAEFLVELDRSRAPL